MWNPNFTYVDSHGGENPSSSSPDVPSSFSMRGLPPGVPVAPLPFSSSSSSLSSTEKGKKRKRQEKEGYDEDELAKKSKRTKLRKAINNDLRFSSVVAMRNRFLQELTLFFNKQGEPWYKFAAAYAAKMGGIVSVDSIVKCYPYDFYNASLWDERKWNSFDYDSEDEIYTTKIDGDDEFDVEEILDKKYEEFFGDLLRDVPATIVKMERGTTNEGEMNPVVAEWMEKAIKALLVKVFRDTKIELEQKGYIYDPKTREAAKEAKRFLKEHYDSNLTKTPIIVARSDAIRPKNYNFKREAKNMNIDLILYGNSGDSEYDAALRDMGTCILKPEFKALIENGVRDINSLCNPTKDFTAWELITSPKVVSQFANFLALSSVPASPKYSTKSPFRSAYSSYASSSSSPSHVTVIQPAQTRVVLANHKVEVESAYRWFSQVVRSSDGDLVHGGSQSSGSSELGRSAPIVTTDYYRRKITVKTTNETNARNRTKRLGYVL